MQRISMQRRADILAEIADGSITFKEVAKRNGVAPSVVSRMAKEHGLSKRTNNKWTTDEIDLLRRKYKVVGPGMMATLLPRHPSASSICHKARELGIETNYRFGGDADED